MGNLHKIIDKLADIIAQGEELKLDSGVTPRTVRQWKKDARSRYLSLVQDKNKLSREIQDKQRDLEHEREQQQADLEERRQQHERRMAELRKRQEEHERRLWEEKMEAELRMTQQKMEMEKSARATTAKMPKLKITPFKGTPTDWVQFENIFLTQVDAKAITEGEKFGYLLELVNQNVRDKIANLKPGKVGYETAWMYHTCRHHTSLCNQENNPENPVFTGYTSPVEGQTLPPMVPINARGAILWAYLDSGSSRNFISSEAIRKLKLTPIRHETRQIVTLSGTTKQSLPIFEVTMTSLDGKTSEKIELTGSKLSVLTGSKSKYKHTADKGFLHEAGR